jgi:magnesium transporter
MTPPPSGPANAAGTQRSGRDTAGAGSGVLGARPAAGQTLHGQDPELVAASSICQVSPTRCQARTRLYRDGRLELEGFPVADISDHLAEGSVTIWLDLRDPDRDDLDVLSEEFGLHPLAVEDALHHSQRPKLDRYPSHLFLTAYAARLDAATGELATSELAAFITSQALITVRKDDGLDIGAAVQRWDQNPDLTRFGVGYLLYGLLDYIVDSHFDAVQSLDDCVEEIEDRLRRHPAQHGSSAAQLPAAQEPRAAAPGGAPDARGGERRDAA